MHPIFSRTDSEKELDRKYIKPIPNFYQILYTIESHRNLRQWEYGIEPFDRYEMPTDDP